MSQERKILRISYTVSALDNNQSGIISTEHRNILHHDKVWDISGGP